MWAIPCPKEAWDYMVKVETALRALRRPVAAAQPQAEGAPAMLARVLDAYDATGQRYIPAEVLREARALAAAPRPETPPARVHNPQHDKE
jgi:hypothetical protein